MSSSPEREPPPEITTTWETLDVNEEPLGCGDPAETAAVEGAITIPWTEMLNAQVEAVDEVRRSNEHLDALTAELRLHRQATEESSESMANYTKWLILLTLVIVAMTAVLMLIGFVDIATR